MLVAHRVCPHCGAYIEDSHALPLCPRCGQSIYTDVSEEEYKRNEQKYRVILASGTTRMTEEDAARWESIMQEKGSKPFFYKGKFPTGLVWIVFFILLAVAGVVFLFKTFDWYSLIVIVVFTLITLYKQKHH